MGLEAELDKRVTIVELRIETLDAQDKRLISHVESERRHQATTSKRIDQIEGRAKRIEDVQDKHDHILRNGGIGLVVRIDRLEQKMEVLIDRITQRDERDDKSYNRWIALASLLVSIGLGIYMIMTKK